ncbi:MAG: amylo-alpha-1,6-glucosidase [Clostridia bacterium]|nr:amylo-alpha-1,6-glucosidase [Clostridia bacterium]
MTFGKAELKDFGRAIEKEWLVTNGLGGFASSTILGANTRRYHGLLFAALRPPTDRTLLLAKLEERVCIENREFALGVNDTANGLYPQGHRYLQQFSTHPLPTYLYSIQDVLIEKIVFMVHGRNTTVIRYNVYTSPDKAIDLKITPLINCRDYHWLTRRNQWPFYQQPEGNGVVIEAFPGAPKLYLAGEGARYSQGPGYWFEGLHYIVEESRGEDKWEDHFMPGEFEVKLTGGGSFAIVASTEPVKPVNSQLWQVQEEKRLSQLVEKAGYGHEFINRLVVAADNFIVRRESTGTKTVIAGYPWFTDWGRDTMIALPGLTLVTKRFDAAKEILTTFARYCKDGLIPNRFPDEGLNPDYNTVDASLWFFHAVHKYLRYTGNYDFIRDIIYPVLKQIVEYHLKGTHFNIHVDKDGLVSAGSHGLQLTWMDAKVDDWVVTPRHGKPVEINALWYNALRVMEKLAQKFDDNPKAYNQLAQKVRKSFIQEFWNDSTGCLYDVIGERKDGSIRPNQIIAVALPFSMLDHSKEVKIVRKVWQHLYTPYGLRSLSPEDPQYKGHYRGDRLQRDGAYHQGTAWSWLIGPFISAYRKVNDYSQESQVVAEKLIEPFKGQLFDHGVGSISEIFDGDHPHEPRGCYAQAWGVAEVLRAYAEEVLEIRP